LMRQIISEPTHIDFDAPSIDIESFEGGMF